MELVNPMKVNVNIQGRLSGELELAPVTVLVGPPRSGKTTLLRLIFDTLYADYFGYEPSELGAINSAVIEIEGLKLTCEDGQCSRERYSEKLKRLNPFYLPTEYELLLKFGMWPPYESYETLRNAWLKLFLRAGQSRCADEYLKVIKGDGLEGKFEFRRVGFHIYEILENLEVPLFISSTTVVKLGALENLFLKGVLDEYDVFLLDNPEVSLHPLAQARLALLIHSLANCDKIVVVASHDVLFVDMLRRVDDVNKIFGSEIRASDVAIYNIVDGKIKRVDTLASYLENYTEYIYAVYGAKVEKVRGGAVIK
ncbi:hypothetical protein Pogu_1142 [Pyrobaculum oguniense TE7]|uniref:ATPase AAA-type core domain-containing protein n=1 Tax=Pyrobaculum oguniense (strain DSM 13380 / JCM 10595 / TE7) TaxID=698757 RepID=H6QA47_PYROT|nr:hypothetical protein Pogu_1142 [Pyrobaculum oguniense TE7]